MRKRLLISLLLGGAALAACHATRPPAIVVHSFTLMGFTKIAIDTFYIKNQDSLFLIKHSAAFLRDWEKATRASDTVDIKKFGFDYVRMWIEVPQSHHDIYLDLGGSHFLYKGKAYAMSDAGVKVLSHYFPNSPHHILVPGMRVVRVVRGKRYYHYQKQNYLPELE